MPGIALGGGISVTIVDAETLRPLDGVSVTGGLSGDGDRFEETLVLWEDAPSTRTVAAAR